MEQPKLPYKFATAPKPAALRYLPVVVPVLLFFQLSTAQVQSLVDTTAIRIGEEIQYTIQVQADTTALVLFPEGQSFAPLEMIESYKTDTLRKDARYQFIKKYGLTQFDSGTYTIPQQRIVINGKGFNTDSVQVEVRDVAVDTTKQKMFDIKEQIAVEAPPIDLKKIALWLLPVLLMIGLLLFLLRRKKIRSTKKQQLPPYEEALVALKQLDESPLLREQRGKAYYTSLTEIVKRYLDREVDETALESTSDELIARLKIHKDAGHLDLGTETIRHLDNVLKRADLVKFAKMQQPKMQATADRRTIEEIITETHEAIPEPTEEEMANNELLLEKRRRQKQRKKWVVGMSALLGALLLGALVYGSVKGFDNLSDAIFGNEIRELSEGRWYKSEYGSPAILIETPEVLVRTPLNGKESDTLATAASTTFTYGSLRGPLYVLVQATKGSPPPQQQAGPDLDAIMDVSLTQLETLGAKNMIVKRDAFQTQKGVKGLKAEGKFNVKTPNGKTLKGESNYELLIFAHQNGVQQIMIVYPND
ncbi:MAG: BatD family protein, partial [Marinirhabdus sp.]